jgi:hypothetical protein
MPYARVIGGTMTRTERAAAQVRKAKEKAAALEQLLKDRLAAQKEETRQAEATLREETRKADNRRRYHVGALAHEAGLFAWSNADIQAVFAVLARLSQVPNPAAVIEGLLDADMQEVFLDPVLVADKSLSRDGIFPVFSARDEGGKDGK